MQFTNEQRRGLMVKYGLTAQSISSANSFRNELGKMIETGIITKSAARIAFDAYCAAIGSEYRNHESARRIALETIR